jgi:hypothetical protein
MMKLEALDYAGGSLANSSTSLAEKATVDGASLKAFFHWESLLEERV